MSTLTLASSSLPMYNPPSGFGQSLSYLLHWLLVMTISSADGSELPYCPVQVETVLLLTKPSFFRCRDALTEHQTGIQSDVLSQS